MPRMHHHPPQLLQQCKATLARAAHYLRFRQSSHNGCCMTPGSHAITYLAGTHSHGHGHSYSAIIALNRVWVLNQAPGDRGGGGSFDCQQKFTVHTNCDLLAKPQPHDRQVLTWTMGRSLAPAVGSLLQPGVAAQERCRKHKAQHHCLCQSMT